MTATMGAMAAEGWAVDDHAASTSAGWVRDFARAVQANSRIVDVRSASPPDVAAAFKRTRYEFHGRAHRIASAFMVEQRGYAACGDAAAAIVAAAVAAGLSGVLCLEAPASMEDYRHVRVMLDDPTGPPVILDPYANRRPVGLAQTCEWVAPFEQFMSPRGPWVFYKSRAQSNRR